MGRKGKIASNELNLNIRQMLILASSRLPITQCLGRTNKKIENNKFDLKHVSDYSEPARQECNSIGRNNQWAERLTRPEEEPSTLQQLNYLFIRKLLFPLQIQLRNCTSEVFFSSQSFVSETFVSFKSLTTISELVLFWLLPLYNLYNLCFLTEVHLARLLL
jgi:hypothetical protein